jgi:hypothetical protein
VFDAGTAADGEVFVAMQLVDGQDLSHALATRAPHPAELLAWFVDARAKDPQSVELAILLLEAGQLTAQTDYAAALHEFQEARAILEARHDPRVALVWGTLAVAATNHGDWATARDAAEQAHAHDLVDPQGSPENVAEIELILAFAIWNTAGDRARARQLAHAARGEFAKLGPPDADKVREADNWLASH